MGDGPYGKLPEVLKYKVCTLSSIHFGWHRGCVRFKSSQMFPSPSIFLLVIGHFSSTLSKRTYKSLLDNNACLLWRWGFQRCLEASWWTSWSLTLTLSFSSYLCMSRWNRSCETYFPGPSWKVHQFCSCQVISPPNGAQRNQIARPGYHPNW